MSRRPSNISRRRHQSQADKISKDFKVRMNRFRLTLRGKSLSKVEVDLAELLMRREFEAAIADLKIASAYRT